MAVWWRVNAKNAVYWDRKNNNNNNKKGQLLCKFSPYVFVTMRSVKLFSFKTIVYTFSHSTHTNIPTHVLYIIYNDMYMHMTTISDFMSFSAWWNKAKLKSPQFLLQGVPIRTFFLKSSKIRNGVRTLLLTKIRLDTGKTMICFFFSFFATDVWTGA